MLNKKLLIGIILITCVTISSFAVLTIMWTTKAELGPVVTPDPPITIIQFCHTREIAICVENFTDVYGFQFKIWWLKEALNLTDYRWNPPPEWGDNYLLLGPAFEENTTHKSAMFGIAAMSPAPPFSHDKWPFVYIAWHCIKYNLNTTLTFDKTYTYLVDDEGNKIPVGEIVDGVVINLPAPQLYWKESYVDYAPSGVPDFSQKQDAWNITGVWSWCTPVAIANSLWWMDSRYEIGMTSPPAIEDTFPLVSSYVSGKDDHAPANVIPLINHLGYLMDTDGIRTGIPHSGTNIHDAQAGITHYLSWTGLNPQGDVNGDGKVDQTDADIVSAAFGSSPGDPRWNMAADIYPVTTGWPSVSTADNVINEFDLLLVANNMNSTGLFYEKTVKAPDFYFIENEVERCEDVILSIGFYTELGERIDIPYDTEGLSGHCVTVAGVNSTKLQIGISDPGVDNAEKGGLGIVLPTGVPHNHSASPPDTVHNNASFVSHDVYYVNLTLPPTIPSDKGKFHLINYNNPYGTGGKFAVVEWAIIISPRISTPPIGEPIKLYDIVEWEWPAYLIDVPFDAQVLAKFTEMEGFTEILESLQAKGYEFNNYATGKASKIYGSVEEYTFKGTVISWWSNNTLEDGTKAFIAAAVMEDETSMVFGVVTNLLPPDQIPGVDPHIIVNAMPYIFVEWHWWDPWLKRIVYWKYWWYDSHSHPNWFWGCYWWWRVYVRTYLRRFVIWIPWWGWWWHWIYWRHWYWWSTWFPYDP